MEAPVQTQTLTQTAMSSARSWPPQTCTPPTPLLPLLSTVTNSPQVSDSAISAACSIQSVHVQAGQGRNHRCSQQAANRECSVCVVPTILFPCTPYTLVMVRCSVCAIAFSCLQTGGFCGSSMPFPHSVISACCQGCHHLLCWKHVFVPSMS